VLGRAGLIAAATPLAWLVHLVERRTHGRAPLGPEETLALAARARALARAEDGPTSS
jgi:hypothetical protein